jgi:hypothetical protein
MVNDSTDIDMLLSSEYSENNSNTAESCDVYIIAGWEKLLPHQLALLAYCGSPRIRARVAENSATPTWLLYHLSQDACPRVRAVLAENPSVTREILDALAKDSSDDVRYSLAENAQIPLEILQVLIEDDNPFVAARAARTLNRRLRSSSLEDKGLRQNQFHLLGTRQLRVLESAS